MQLFQRLFTAMALAWHLTATGAALPAPAATAAPGKDPYGDYPVIPMQHASWTAGAGAPTGVNGITQTPDGWLWVASAAGLFRFDGVRFERTAGALAPLSANIFEMGVLADGTLWLTYRFGGISLVQHGRMRHFRAGAAGVPAGTIGSVGQDADGRIWMGGQAGLRILAADGVWRVPATQLGAPAGLIRSMLLDRGGVFWLRTADDVFSLPKHGAHFTAQNLHLPDAGTLAQDPAGSVWTSTQTPGLRLVSGVPGADPHAWDMPESVNHIVFDHAGVLWEGDNFGVQRTLPQGAVRHERMGVADGLSGTHCHVLFEDREHNFWVGTENGVDRFRPFRLQPLPLSPYLLEARPLATGRTGGAWIDRAFLATPASPPAPFAPPSSIALTATAIHAAADGTVWSGGRGGLWHLHDGRRDVVAMPPGVPDPLRTSILSMTTDAAGALWISMGRLGTFVLKDGQWQAHGGIPDLADFPTTALATDAQGRIWLGSSGDQIRLLAHGAVRRFGRADGLALGSVLAITPAPDLVWVGGENGIAGFDGQRFISVLGRGGEPFAGTSGLVLGRDGTLWLNGAAGITSIAPAELRQALRDPGHQVRFGRLDYRDGLLGTAAPIIPLPSATASRDGTLWFSTQGGVFAIDPARLARNRLVPPVVITAVKAGGTDHTAVDGLRLPAGTRALEVDFTALTYAAPERVEFRYLLDGVDSGWQDSHGRRAAQYTNLAPGHYVFRVIGANDDGLWNTRGATLAFDIVPGMMQTVWARGLCGGAVLLALWLLHRMRLRHVARRLALQMNARIDERERIARELHDTLLQSIMGLVLKIGAAVHRLRDDERKPLEDAVATARQVLGEGRDRVAGLRGADLRHGGLARAITDFGTSLARDSAITFACTVKGTTAGTAVTLDPVVAEEVLAIARETIWNAFVHAQPRHVTATLQYGSRELLLTVADDGCGIAPEVMAAGARPGHFGLPGLRERAARIGAVLDLASRPGSGTLWTLRVVLTTRATDRDTATVAAPV